MRQSISMESSDIIVQSKLCIKCGGFTSLAFLYPGYFTQRLRSVITI